MGHLRFQVSIMGMGWCGGSTPWKAPCALPLSTAFLGKWNTNLLFLIAMLWENMATCIEQYEFKIPGRLLRVSKMKENLKVTPS